MPKSKIQSAVSVFFPTIRKESSKFCETSVLDELYETTYKLEDGQRVHKRVNDVTLLFNQDRLEKEVGVDTLNAWLKQMNNGSSSAFDELRKNVKDDELLDFVKSRHIQTLSELSLWSNYLSGEYANEVSRYEKAKTADVEKAKTADVETKSLDMETSKE